MTRLSTVASMSMSAPVPPSPPEPGNREATASRRVLRSAGVVVLFLCWVAVALLLTQRVIALVLVAVLLVVVFRLSVLRRSVRRVWSDDTLRSGTNWRRRSLLVLVPVALVAAAVLQSAGSWMDDSWTVLLLAVALLVVGVASRRLLLTVIVATATVLAATAVMAPRLASTPHGDPGLTAQLQDLTKSGALRGFQDLAVSEVDLSGSKPVRQASIGSLTASSPMEIGSITKALTGLVVEDAVTRGELSLSSPVSTYLPELAGSAAGSVTMRELITHHGGYPQFDGSSMRRAILSGPFGAQFLTSDRAETLADAKRASLTTRGSYVYSSLGAAVAGQAAAKAAGLTYPDLMRTRLFEPLAMTHTSIPTTTSPAVPGRSASGLPTQTWHVDGYAPAGAAVSTAHDLTLLATALLDGTAPGLRALDPLDSGETTNTKVGGFWQVSHWDNGQTITWHNGQTSGHTAYLGLDRGAGKAVILLADVARDDVTDTGVRLLSQMPTPVAAPADLYRVGDETLHLQCQGTGSPTVVMLAGQGDNTSTWRELRTRLGPDVRTCAWDYPGAGASTGTPMMTAQRAASALESTLRAADVPGPIVLVGHSIGGLTTRLFVGQHPSEVSGVVLFDPTVAEFARDYDQAEFRPGWDGTASADQVEQVTRWPDIPVEILRHDPAVYAANNIWDARVEARWGAAQDGMAALTTRGNVTVIPGAGHYIYRDAPEAAVAAVTSVLTQVAAEPRGAAGARP